MEFQNSAVRVVIGGADGLNMRVPHLHREYELYYLLEGERLFFIRNVVHRIGPGSLALLDGEELHRVFSPADMPHRRMVIFFQKNAVTDPKLQQMFQSGSCLPLSRAERTAFEQLIERLVGEMEGKQIMCNDAVEALLKLLLVAAYRAYLTPHTPLQYGGSIVSEAVAYINAHYAQPLSLPVLCAQLHISVSHFTSIFKLSTGFTFVEYLNHVRIQRAANLLANARIHISEVAEMVGFSSFSYFSKKFKEIRGISPLQYRFQVQKEW